MPFFNHILSNMKYSESEQLPIITYEDPADYFLMFPKIIGDKIFTTENAGDVMALYYFYCYTAKWQRTNQVKATTEYCMKGLDFGKPRFRFAKNTLLKLGLIENVKKGNGGGWFIKIIFVPGKKLVNEQLNLRSQNSNKLENKQVRKLTTNALSFNNINALSSNTEKKKKINKKEIQTFKRTKPRKQSIPDFYFEFKFFKKDFAKIWFDEFIPLKKRKKASITERALKTQLKKISEYSKDSYTTALEILEKSINGGWSDVYPLNGNAYNKPNNNSGTFAHSTTQREKYSKGRAIYDTNEI